MPLTPGNSRSAISSNISELTHHGSIDRPHRQIVAIALSNARRYPRSLGGNTPVDREEALGFSRPYLDNTLGPLTPIPGSEDKPLAPGDLEILDRIKNSPQYPQRANGGSAIERALRIAHRAEGGFSGSDVPYFERQEARGIGSSPYGFTAGLGGGRTDKNNVSVGSGSYIIPADVVAGLGDGNSLAGAKVWDSALSAMPWGISRPQSTGHRGFPPPPHDPALMQGITGTSHAVISPTLAKGGKAEKDEDHEEVPIASADGEIILSPEQVLCVGQHYSPQKDIAAYPATHSKMMKHGHAILDAFVKEQRGRTIKKLKSLKGPVGSRDPHRGHT